MKKQTIEFAGEAVGALMPDNGRLRFVAVKYSVWPLDGRIFATAEEALRAVAALHVLRQRGPVGARAAPTGRGEAFGASGSA
ncbi:hypothetical protein AU381_03645 [Sinorhizobium glycinis]|uniref:Uncharacterized protein n=1 Tax=Sinorhizobium glycinis TaxID=1472378 RepID=A0A178Y0I5_9HYPH|nr:hypothetical protein [Sinorhizobium glycinis]OAP40991.1 hypothetical protein AU381_03645 [Sinorhizobium glycinis]